jgi:hypothetical protein
MTEAKKPANTKILTLAGIAKFPYLNTADTKFNPEGEYRIRLILDDDANQEKGTNKGRSIREMLEEAAQKIHDETKADLEQKFKEAKGADKAKIKKALDGLKLADLPVRAVYDDDGNETDQIEIAFKMKAQRKDKKTGAVIKMVPKLFDAKGRLMAKDPAKAPAIWGGSRVKVAGSVIPFYTAAVGAGVSLRLAAVQVIQLQTNDGGSASSYGFGEEDGYEAEEQEESEQFSDESDSSDDEEF